MNQDQQKFVSAAQRFLDAPTTELTPYEEAELYADALNNKVIRGLGLVYRRTVFTMIAQGRITKDADDKWYAVRVE